MNLPIPSLEALSALSIAGLLLSMSTDPARGEEPDPSQLTLERIFTDEEFKARSFDGRWLEDRSAFTFLKRDGKKDEKAIWLRDPNQPEPELLVAAGDLIPQGEDAPLTIDGYEFAKDLRCVLIYTNSQRVWRRNTRGDYWILDRETEALRKIGGDADEASLMFAKFSPNADRVAYVLDRDLYVESLDDHAITRLTRAEHSRIINGTSDWVYEEELGVRDGFRWSPDGRHIAYWQFDTTGVRRHIMLDHVSGLYPKRTVFAYPKTGQQNSAVRAGVVSASGGLTRWFKLPGSERDHYLARLDWADNSEEVILQQLNRPQSQNRVFLGDVEDGSVKELLTETDEAWIDIHDGLFWLNEGQQFTWISERNGWQQLFLVSRDGSSVTPVTPLGFDVIQLLQVDEANQRAYFIASPENPAERYLYSIGIDGGDLKRVTPAREKRGTHSYRIAEDAAHAFVVSSHLDRPPVTKLVTLPDHRVVQTLEANRKVRRAFDALDRSPAEFFYVKIDDGEPLQARALFPPDFDPDGRYPLLIYVYGEPFGQVVRDSWEGSGHLWHHFLAQQGYVVMSVDNRGTKAPRGRDFRKSVYRQIGVVAPQEQAAAVRRILDERPYLDPNRVGSWGWSGGGSMSLNAIFKFPDLYRTAIAVASVPDQRHYDTIYQERYMDHPAENREGYKEGSPIHFAHQLEGDLLLIHGAADDNCHYQTFEKLIDKLVQHNKPFRMMTYPRGTHSIKEGENTSLHLFSLMTQFLRETLPLDPR